MPVSNETRVRVDGLSKMSATLFPSSARDASRSTFSSSARSTSARSSAAVSSSPVRKWVGTMRVLSWNLYHGRDFPPDPALFTWRSRLFRVTERNATHAQVNRPLLREFGDVLDGIDWDIALLQEAPPLWFRALGRRTRSSGVRVL